MKQYVSLCRNKKGIQCPENKSKETSNAGLRVPTTCSNSFTVLTLPQSRMKSYGIGHAKVAIMQKVALNTITDNILQVFGAIEW